MTVAARTTVLVGDRNLNLQLSQPQPSIPTVTCEGNIPIYVVVSFGTGGKLWEFVQFKISFC